VLGEEHPNTAESYNNVAHSLKAQGKLGEALPLYEKALQIRRQVLGELHPHTAASYNNVAGCLKDQGKPGEALPLSEKALQIRRKMLGELHPLTASSYNNVASCLNDQGEIEKAVGAWQAALAAHDLGRITSAESGFGRSYFGARSRNPRQALAVVYARQGKAEQAWSLAEENLARGLLDDLNKASDPLQATVRSQVAKLDERLVVLFGNAELSPEQKRQREQLLSRRKELLEELSKRAADRSARLVWSRQRIQKQIPADAAALFWVRELKDCWACVLRTEGPPCWVRVPGSAEKGDWSKEDDRALFRLHETVADAERRRCAGSAWWNRHANCGSARSRRCSSPRTSYPRFATCSSCRAARWVEFPWSCWHRATGSVTFLRPPFWHAPGRTTARWTAVPC
jgi:hypothetical protein